MQLEGKRGKALYVVAHSAASCNKQSERGEHGENFRAAQNESEGEESSELRSCDWTHMNQPSSTKAVRPTSAQNHMMQPATVFSMKRKRYL